MSIEAIYEALKQRLRSFNFERRKVNYDAGNLAQATNNFVRSSTNLSLRQFLSSPTNGGNNMSLRLIFSEKKPESIPLSSIIRQILSENPEVCDKIETYMTNPGVEGSVNFDHAGVVNVLRENSNGHDLYKVPGKKIYDTTVRVMRSSDVKIEHGRISGLLEYEADHGSPHADQ